MLGQKYMDSIYTSVGANNTNVWIINLTLMLRIVGFRLKRKRTVEKEEEQLQKMHKQLIVNVLDMDVRTTAFNYSNLAIVNDGTCCYVDGCTDPTANN